MKTFMGFIAVNIMNLYQVYNKCRL